MRAKKWQGFVTTLDDPAGHRRPQSVSLVGNGPIPATASSHVDRNDLVIRINRAILCGTAGERTDVLVVVNHSDPGRTMATTHPINELAIEGAREFWFTHHPTTIASWTANRSKSPDSDWTEPLIKKIVRGRPLTFLPYGIKREARRAIQEFGDVTDKVVSTGAAVLYHLMKTWPQAKVDLFGFTHEGWDGHPWEAERNWMDHLLAQGIARRISS